jgi:hypothetical protein
MSEITVRHSRPIDQQAALKQTNLRIGVAVVFVIAELWALSSALGTWTHGGSLKFFVILQAMAFAATVLAWKAVPVQRPALPLRSPQPAPAD